MVGWAAVPDQRISSSAYDLPAYVYATFTDEGAMLLDTRGKGTWFAINAAGAHYLSVLVSGGSAPAGISALVKRYQIDQGMASAEDRKSVV